jgi:hypothetical protein
MNLHPSIQRTALILLVQRSNKAAERAPDWRQSAERKRRRKNKNDTTEALEPEILNQDSETKQNLHSTVGLPPSPLPLASL